MPTAGRARRDQAAVTADPVVNVPRTVTTLVAGAAAVGVSGVVALVLIGGLVGADAPTVGPLVGGAAVAAGVAGALIWARPGVRLALGLQIFAVGLPFGGLVLALYPSDALADFFVLFPQLGFTLAAGHGAAIGLVTGRALRRPIIADAGFGGMVGVGAAVLIHVAAVVDRFEPWWAGIGWVVGAAAFALLARLPPAPVRARLVGIPVRLEPLSAAWLTALIVSVPGPPRHDLSTSTGAQTLSVLLAVYVVAAVVIVWTAERASRGAAMTSELRRVVRRMTPSVVALTLLGIGGLQAASYSAVALDDLARYWSVADSMRFGLGYDIWGGGPGVAQTGGDQPWMDLPTFPASLVATFALFGHNFPAALAPMFVANVALPGLIYLGARAMDAGRLVAFSVALFAVLAPPIQIYSLGAAEPDPLFVALLALCAWLFVAVVRGARPRQMAVGFGAAAGALALTRPEGPVYAGLLLAAVLVVKRDRWAVGAAAAAVALAAPFVGLSLAQVGRVWPQQPQGLSIVNLQTNAETVGTSVWPAIGRILLLDDVRFHLIVAVILGLFVAGSVEFARRRPALLALPAAAVVNVIITMSLAPVALSTNEPSEFVRHIAPPFPVVAIVAAAGVVAIGRAMGNRPALLRWARVAALAGVVYLIVGSLYLLATPEEFHHGNRSGSLLRADIYVNAPELWGHAVELPCPPCLAEEWDFETFRDRLFDAYRPFDNHSVQDGAAYATLTGALAALGLATVVVSSGGGFRGASKTTNAPSSAIERAPDIVGQ